MKKAAMLLVSTEYIVRLRVSRIDLICIQITLILTTPLYI